MQNRDEFDGPDMRGAIGSIFKALDRRERIAPRKPVWAAATVGALVLFLGSVLWYSYPRQGGDAGTEAVPIIRADAGPIKIAPLDPEGMEIPHRDSTVFDTLRVAQEEGQGQPRRVENLLDEPEEPIDRDQFFAGVETKIMVEGREVSDSSEDEVSAPSVIAKQEEAAPEPQEQKIAAAPAEAVTEDITAQPAPAVVAEKAPEPTPEPEQIASAATPLPQAKPEKQIAEELSRTEPAAGVETFESGSGGWYAQLASLRSDDAAKTAWADLTKSLSSLRTVSHRVEKADLGARGVYYRLQAGPFAEAKAREVCAAVEAQRPGGCIVIKN